jgi:hypothetical protein
VLTEAVSDRASAAAGKPGAGRYQRAATMICERRCGAPGWRTTRFGVGDRAQTNRLRVLLRAGDDTDRGLARARLSDAVRRRAGPAPPICSRQQAVRHLPRSRDRYFLSARPWMASNTDPARGV